MPSDEDLPVLENISRNLAILAGEVKRIADNMDPLSVNGSDPPRTAEEVMRQHFIP